jgi:hypothetical protein
MWVIEMIVGALIRIVIETALAADDWIFGGTGGERRHPNDPFNLGRPGPHVSERDWRDRHLR